MHATSGTWSPTATPTAIPTATPTSSAPTPPGFTYSPTGDQICSVANVYIFTNLDWSAGLRPLSDTFVLTEISIRAAGSENSEIDVMESACMLAQMSSQHQSILRYVLTIISV